MSRLTTPRKRESRLTRQRLIGRCSPPRICAASGQRSALILALVAGALVAPSCLAQSDQPLEYMTDDDAGPDVRLDLDGAAPDVSSELAPVEPHSVFAIEPSHGAFTGGQQVIVRGTGFASDVRVWFGEVEVDPSQRFPIDPGRVQVLVPPGKAGLVDVVVQNGTDRSTRASLLGGYVYDAFYAEPKTGPTSGGTLVTLHGESTSWDDDTQVFIDRKPCEVTEVESPTQLTCRAPPGSHGTKAVRVRTSDGVELDVLDAFTYSNSNNGYRGGLSGDALSEQLKVLVLSNVGGNALPGATVILGNSLDDALIETTNPDGVALFTGASLGPTRSVTVARKCFHPVTLIDVPVDTVTLYLDPVLSPTCAEGGEIPTVGGTPGLGSMLEGELIWFGGTEFKRPIWTNVPRETSADERRVAYVFRTSSNPTRNFTLPSANAAITPDSAGEVGFSFSVSASPGNFTLYALAGIENRTFSPPLFTAYAMGVVKGVVAEGGQTTSEVLIPMDVPLDHALSLDITPPKPTDRGPDRVRASVAVRIDESGYAILPAGQQVRLLPANGVFDFVGVPSLGGSLSGAQFVTSASAFTGSADGVPRSVSGLFATSGTQQPVSLAEFVAIPALQTPGINGIFDGKLLEVAFGAGGANVELTVLELSSGSGLKRWGVVAPGAESRIELPNLSELGTELGLIPGPVSITVSAAHIRNFDYGSVRSRQLEARGWDAYATDVYFAHY